MVYIIDNYAVLAPRFTGTLSAISSFLIIYVICLSPTKLRTTYHRIMFGMSVADILSSVAVALTTLPMPRELPPQMVEQLEQSSNGTDFTRIGSLLGCKVQGVFFSTGIFAMFGYNTMLCVYYAAAIAFKMRERKITKYLEPLFHGVPIIFGLYTGIASLVKETHHTGSETGLTAWCIIAEFPDHNGDTSSSRYTLMIFVAFLFLCIIISFGLIIWRVVMVDKILKRMSQRLLRRSSSRLLNRIMTCHNTTKVILIQAAAYVLSYVLTLTFPLIRSNVEGSQWAMRATFVLIPLQGFFNAVIFMSHKVYNYRRVNQEHTILFTICSLMKGSGRETFYFTRLSLLNIDERRQHIDLEIFDDANNQEHLVIQFNCDSVDDLAGQSAAVFIDEEEKRDGSALSGFSAPNLLSTSSKSVEKQDDYGEIHEMDRMDEMQGFYSSDHETLPVENVNYESSASGVFSAGNISALTEPLQKSLQGPEGGEGGRGGEDGEGGEGVRRRKSLNAHHQSTDDDHQQCASLLSMDKESRVLVDNDNDNGVNDDDDDENEDKDGSDNRSTSTGNNKKSSISQLPTTLKSNKKR